MIESSARKRSSTQALASEVTSKQLEIPRL